MLEFTRRDVSRGFTLRNAHAYNVWCTRSNLKEPFLASYVHFPLFYEIAAKFVCRTHAPLYPLPTSFPPIFTIDPTYPRATPLFTSLRTTPRTSSLFCTFARFVETNLEIGNTEGLDKDDMKELGNDLWGICDGFGVGDEIFNDRDELGEDEE